MVVVFIHIEASHVRRPSSAVSRNIVRKDGAVYALWVRAVEAGGRGVVEEYPSAAVAAAPGVLNVVLNAARHDDCLRRVVGRFDFTGP